MFVVLFWMFGEIRPTFGVDKLSSFAIIPILLKKWLKFKHLSLGKSPRNKR
jgi:hypothetical protein